MAADILDDVIFPDHLIATSARGSKSYDTRIVANATREQRNARRSLAMRRYDIGLVARTGAQWAEIAALHDVLVGRTYAGLLRDPVDNAASLTEGLLRPLPGALTGSLGTAGLGYGVPNYRMLKRTGYLSRSVDRDVRKPRSGSITLKRNGATVTIGASAGNAAIDYVNGNVTFVADSSSTVTVVTVGATTQVTLTAALAGLAVGGRLYLAGLGGADAALLNGLSHSITAITGGGLNVYTLATNTTSKTITAGGSGYKYPQPTDTLTWSGGFYVPVRFDLDDMGWAIEAGSPSTATLLISGPSVPLVEVPLA